MVYGMEWSGWCPPKWYHSLLWDSRRPDLQTLVSTPPQLIQWETRVTRQLRVTSGTPENAEEPILVSHVQHIFILVDSTATQPPEQTLIDVQYRYSAHHQSRSSTSSPFPRVVAVCEYIELWMAEELTLINFLWAHFEGDPFTSSAQRGLSFKWLLYYCYSTGASRRVPLSVSARLMMHS